MEKARGSQDGGMWAMWVVKEGLPEEGTFQRDPGEVQEKPCRTVARVFQAKGS